MRKLKNKYLLNMLQKKRNFVPNYNPFPVKNRFCPTRQFQSLLFATEVTAKYKNGKDSRKRKPQRSRQTFENSAEIESTSVSDIQSYADVAFHRRAISKLEVRYTLPRNY